MNELIEVPGPESAAPSVTGGAKAAIAFSIVVFSGIVLWTGLSEILMPPAKVRLMGQERVAATDAKKNRNFWDGSLARSFETEFRLGGVVRRKVGPYWSLIMLKVGDIVTPDVILGKDEWLFLRDRVELDRVRAAGAKTLFSNVMGALNRSLAARGTTLVMMPLVRKGVACQGQLPEGFDPNPQFDRDVIDDLKARGVYTVDVYDKWRSMEAPDVYKSQDTHWAMPARIEAISELVRTVPGIPRDEIEAGYELVGDQSHGGILNFIGISARHPMAAYADMASEKKIKLMPPSFASELRAGTYPSRILHVGTSFSAGFQFSTLLAGQLKAGVDDASELGQTILRSLTKALKARIDRLPEFLVVEFPIYQAATYRRVSNTSNLISAAVLTGLTEGVSYDDVPVEFLAPPNKNAHLRGPKSCRFARRVLISSGDGVMLLELLFEGDAPSKWTLGMDGATLSLNVPAGSVRRVFPLIEGAKVSEIVSLRLAGKQGGGTNVTANVLADVNLGEARPVEGTIDSAGTWGFQGQLDVARFDALIIRWGQKSSTPLGVTVTGRDAQGEIAQQSWSLAERARSRFALFTVGAFVDGEITEIRVTGVAGEVEVSLGSKPE